MNFQVIFADAITFTVTKSSITLNGTILDGLISDLPSADGNTGAWAINVTARPPPIALRVRFEFFSNHSRPIKQ